MDWINNFFIPLFQVIFIFGILFLGIVALSVGLYLHWRKTWKHHLKYQIKKAKPDQKDIDWLNDVKVHWTREEIKMNLMLSGQNQFRAYELLFIYDMLLKNEVKKNG